MKNNVLVSLIVICTVMLLQGCSSGGTSTANADSINTSAKVLASNVVIDSKFMNTSSSTVQSALENINPSRLNMIVGTWNTYSYFGDQMQGNAGNVSINSDGTFIINNGNNAFWPVLASVNTYADLSNKTGKWKLLRGVLLQLSIDENLGGLTQTVYPLITTYNKNKFGLNSDGKTVIFEKVP